MNPPTPGLFIQARSIFIQLQKKILFVPNMNTNFVWEKVGDI